MPSNARALKPISIVQWPMANRLGPWNDTALCLDAGRPVAARRGEPDEPRSLSRLAGAAAILGGRSFGSGGVMGVRAGPSSLCANHWATYSIFSYTWAWRMRTGRVILSGQFDDTVSKCRRGIHRKCTNQRPTKYVYGRVLSRNHTILQ